ncbi:hypothetical protein ASPZODRAFT_232426 [Penicilliopsis zonata CBS 506.65]|uniref:Beta/gamma crystallin 'Greek key' domain-containing protein n=1 Tax=Penicilliopsis zonata CBS 506.65 TaxID=1073090 RepID=A0A1L9SUA4_9EURO|nr:hypothetical protein ASPZODRAFT_232426 [Penicilliopsis zonata CBS 506.65]OJJ50653.1 hypothetical protein ASPZODRAFT_232426 [Penicilliopsis zonata CBS 506.65]
MRSVPLLAGFFALTHAKIILTLYSQDNYQGDRGIFSPSDGSCLELPDQWKARAVSLTLNEGYYCLLYTYESGCDGNEQLVLHNMTQVEEPFLSVRCGQVD